MSETGLSRPDAPSECTKRAAASGSEAARARNACARRRVRAGSIAALCAIGLVVAPGCSKKPTDPQAAVGAADTSQSATAGATDTAVAATSPDAAGAATSDTPGSDSSKPAADTRPAAASDATAATADAKALAQADASDATPAADVQQKPLSKDALAKAYVEIYCAQRRGKTRELYAIYERHGFAEPLAWRRAWDAAATDSQWVADLTKRALDACQ